MMDMGRIHSGYHEEKTCAICGKPFDAHAPNTKCCPACRAGQKKGTVAYLKTCKICGRHFVTGQRNRRYCDDCLAKGFHAPRKCKCCGQVFAPITHSRGGARELKYCPDCLAMMDAGERKEDIQRARVNLSLKAKEQAARAAGMSYGMYSAWVRLKGAAK